MVSTKSSFDYKFSSIGDLVVNVGLDEKSGKRVVSDVLVEDEPIKPTERFWNSLYARYGFNKSFFKYFQHDEVFQRISDVESRDRIRLCIHHDDESGESQLLAVSSPAKPVVRYDDLTETLGQYRCGDIRYSDGIVESTHRPRVGVDSFEISGDAFSNRFIMSTPIDGYGLPNIYLSLLRQVCSNGMVGYAKTFRSTLALGRGDEDVSYSIIRALDGFGNDEGYTALRQRFEAATKSYASVQEAVSLHKQLIRSLNRKQIDWSGAATSDAAQISPLDAASETTAVSEGEIGSPMIAAFHRMTGDIQETYGIANLDALSAKRKRTLPVQCTVYDLLNFVSEVATHYSNTQGNRGLQAWLGTIISAEYDLENSCDVFDEFDDFFIDRKLNGEVMKDLQKS